MSLLQRPVHPHETPGPATGPSPVDPRREVAAAVARAIDAVAHGPVLVVGSLPPGGRDLDLLAAADDVRRIGGWLQRAGFVRVGHTWARLGGPDAYAVELTSLAAWATSADDGSSLLIGAEPLPDLDHLRRPSAAATLLLAARGTATRRGSLHTKARRRVDAALHRDPHAWRHAEELARGFGAVGAITLLRRAHEHPGSLRPWDRSSGLLRVLTVPGPLSGRTRFFVGVRPRHLRPRLVSFSGLDGSGKSTQVARLQASLAEVGVTADVQWAGFRSARLVRILLPLLDRPRVGDAPRDPLVPSRLRTTRAGRTAWVHVVAAVNVVHLWRLVLRRRGARILLLDRFAPDTTVKIDLHFLRSRGVPTRSARGLFTLLAPRPDVAFLMEVSPEVAYRRRQEQPLEELTAMAELYREQVDRYGLRVLDGTRDPGELADLIAAEVWQGLA